MADSEMIIYLRSTLQDMAAIIGNVDKGHGPNAAKLRGDMLMSLKELANMALDATEIKEAPRPTAP